jgi:hypothetical protein
VDDDGDQNIFCTVTASNGSGGTTSANSNTVGPIAQAEPQNTAVPTISGTTTQGQTLTAANGTWTNSPSSYAYQWRRTGVDIGGATSSTYLLDLADVGETITVRVTASNASGAGPSATSASTAVIATSGAQVHGWNPADKSASVVLTNSFRTATGPANWDGHGVRSITSRNTGKRMVEISTSSYTYVGISRAGFTYVWPSSGSFSGAIVSYPDDAFYTSISGSNVLMFDGSPQRTEPGVLTMAFDFDANLMWIAFGTGDWNQSGTANPATGTGGISIASIEGSGGFFVYCGLGLNGEATINTGESAFTKTLPSGFSAWAA